MGGDDDFLVFFAGGDEFFDDDVGGDAGGGEEEREGRIWGWALDLGFAALAVEDNGEADIFGIMDDLEYLGELSTGWFGSELG